MKEKFRLMLAALVGVWCLNGCGNEVQESTVMQAGETQREETQREETQSERNEVVGDTSGTAILVVSFGTSYNDSRDITIGAIENAVAQEFPQYEVRRAFTSQIIIDKLKERDGLEIDNVEEALERAAADGIAELIVQPTHLMDGYEYNDLKEALGIYAEKFKKITLAEPLLASDGDFAAVASAITERTASYDDGETAICFMGHGTEADSNSIYAGMQEALTEAGFENYYIGTVEAEPTLEDVMKTLEEKGIYKRVVLEPLMVVAGDHANNDMAGDEEDSWKTVLENAGYEVECILEGLGQLPAIQKLYVKHTKEALENGTVIEAKQAEGTEKEEGKLEDGTYEIRAESDSSMFRIEAAVLTVTEGEMQALITLGGTGYSKLYMGTAQEAAEASEEEFLPFREDASGAYTYEIPVKALDEGIDCAAFSKKKEEWYDRKITFLSDTISAAEEGLFTIEVTLAGGSGKASVETPTALKREGDKMTATIQWSSPDYDYMLVNGEKYLPVNEEGNSVFEIPVAKLDEKLEVTADTVAMSTPHEIEYTFIFHSDTLQRVE